jgi:hypothetical protein
MKVDSIQKINFLISLLEKKRWILSSKHSGSHWRRYCKVLKTSSGDGNEKLLSFTIGPRTLKREIRIGNKWILIKSYYISQLDVYDIIALPF